MLSKSNHMRIKDLDFMDNFLWNLLSLTQTSTIKSSSSSSSAAPLSRSPDNIADAKCNNNQNKDWCDFLIALLPWSLPLIQQTRFLKKKNQTFKKFKLALLLTWQASSVYLNESGWSGNVFKNKRISRYLWKLWLFIWKQNIFIHCDVCSM